MDLSYNEEQTLLRDAAQRFLRAEYDYARRQRIAAGDDGYSREIWAQFAEMGWLALPLPEAHGGLGGGMVELGLLLQAFGGALVVEPYLPTVVLGAGAIALAGDARQQAALLPAVAAGESLLAFAHGERQQRDPRAALCTTARRSRDGWRLDGVKPAVPGAHAADVLIVSARVFDAVGELPGTPGLFLVPAAATGLHRTPCELIDGTRGADVELHGVTVAADALLGQRRDASAQIDTLLDHAAIALAADALGALEVLLDATVEYSKTRVQFGQPIGRFQALQHRMAEMALEREEARAILQFALIAADGAPVTRARAAAAVKVKVGRVARHIAEQAVQIHGGMGVTDELAIGAYLKRVLQAGLLFGSADHHLRRYAQLARESGFLSQGLIADAPAPALAAAG